MPSLHQLAAMRADLFPDTAQFMGRKSIVTRKHDWFHPEFAGPIFPLYL